MKNITNEVFYVGVNDYDVDLFEGQYNVPDGMSYNSYVILDRKTAVLDTVDRNFGKEWMENVEEVLDGKYPDYLIINHMEPDHSANIKNFVEKFPNVKVVGNAKTFVMIDEFFAGLSIDKVVVKDGDKLSLGTHELTFIFAPMVHWPEVMVTYDKRDKALYSADAFGKFGALGTDGKWEDEARRYYFGIVGKYGVQVQSLIKKLSVYEISVIYPLHGPWLAENLSKYLGLYVKWSSYMPEIDGVMIAYTSIYGHTKAAAELLFEELKNRGIKNVTLRDLSRSDWSVCVAEAFCFDKLVLATTTYNGDVFPAMRNFIEDLTERNYQRRIIGIIENGSWAPVAAKAIKTKFEKCKEITFASNEVKIRSSLNKESIAAVKALADELSK